MCPMCLLFYLGSGPFPGVIDIFGSGGGLPEYRAALLASRGFSVFALPYFAYEDLPASFAEVSLDYFIVSIPYTREHMRYYLY